MCIRHGIRMLQFQALSDHLIVFAQVRLLTTAVGGRWRADG
jgi:hypothetical protein